MDKFDNEKGLHMIFFNLQVACLVIVLLMAVRYMKDAIRTNMPCNHYFDALLIIAPWAIIFDGITAYTVNHRDLIPDIWNKVLHAVFFITDDLMVVFAFLCMLHYTSGIPKARWKKLLCVLPGILSILGVLVFMGDLQYIAGKSTDYSMGTSVIISFASLVVHYALIFVVLFTRKKYIEKRKRSGIITVMGISSALLIFQIIFPEILITSVFPVVMIFGFYSSMEDPAIYKLQVFNQEMVMSFSTLVENRDNNTGGHIKRTKGYVGIILEGMEYKPGYHFLLTQEYIRNVLNAAPMHDLGKIATPDYILQKPGKLTDEEYAIMKQHSVNGGEMVKEIMKDMDDPEFMQIAYEVARYHHEKWNGTGYPEGLKEKEIPLHARIMAIADVFDAVSAKRCYRDAMPIEKCFHIIEEGRGKDFDPNLVDVFFEQKEKILELYHTNA